GPAIRPASRIDRLRGRSSVPPTDPSRGLAATPSARNSDNYDLHNLRGTSRFCSPNECALSPTHSLMTCSFGHLRTDRSWRRSVEWADVGENDSEQTWPKVASSGHMDLGFKEPSY